MDAAMSSARSSPEAVKVLLLLALSPAAASMVIAKARKKRAWLLPGAAADASSAAPFQCRTCGRRFATFQALGGHRTSHKRPRVRADGLDLLLGKQPGKGAAARVPVVPHRCGACGQTFATGQALGGHMRRHRTPGAADAIGTSSSSLLSSAGLSGPSDDDVDENDAWPSTLIHFI